MLSFTPTPSKQWFPIDCESTVHILITLARLHYYNTEGNEVIARKVWGFNLPFLVKNGIIACIL